MNNKGERLWLVILEESHHEYCNSNTEDAVFKFAQKEVTDRLISKKTEYDPDEVSKLWELISTLTSKSVEYPMIQPLV